MPSVQLKAKNGNHISFLPSTMILKCSGGMYVTYTSEIFPDPRSKKQVFVEKCLGLFLAGLGFFLPFRARPSRYRAWFQASSGGNWPDDEAGPAFRVTFRCGRCCAIKRKICFLGAKKYQAT